MSLVDIVDQSATQETPLEILHTRVKAKLVVNFASDVVNSWAAQREPDPPMIEQANLAFTEKSF